MTTRRTRHEDPQPPAEAAAAREAEIADLKARVEQVQAELEETASRHLRLAADFENYKKRARQDQMDTIRYAGTEMILRLLPVLDDFKLILEHAPRDVDEAWLKGVRLTEQKLEELLTGQGVTAIESVGERFDPSLHEAVAQEETDEEPEDTVVQELRRGYRLHDRVIRPALVKVARPALPGA
ncbi:MAG: nucleotide exchange factor GrpE [Candidatus Dormibacterales bacterium]